MHRWNFPNKAKPNIPPEPPEPITNTEMMPDLQRLALSYLIVNVEYEAIKQLNERFSEVGEIIYRNQGIIDRYFNSSLLALFGTTHTPQGNHSENCRLAMRSLLEKHGNYCRVVYGDGIGSLAMVGSETCFQYGLFLPDLKERFEVAQDLELGHGLEIRL